MKKLVLLLTLFPIASSTFASADPLAEMHDATQQMAAMTAQMAATTEQMATTNGAMAQTAREIYSALAEGNTSVQIDCPFARPGLHLRIVYSEAGVKGEVYDDAMTAPYAAPVAANVSTKTGIYSYFFENFVKSPCGGGDCPGTVLNKAEYWLEYDSQNPLESKVSSRNSYAKVIAGGIHAPYGEVQFRKYEAKCVRSELK